MFKAKIDISDLQKKLAQVTGPDLTRDIAQAVAKGAMEAIVQRVALES